MDLPVIEVLDDVWRDARPSSGHGVVSLVRPVGNE
jgi:hypothetical protein